MTEPANKTVVQRLIGEVLGNGHVELLPALVAPSQVTHVPLGDHYGPEGVRLEINDYRTAFPDLVVTIESLLADGDEVVCCFTLRGTHRRSLWDIPPSGQPVSLRGIGIYRLAAGCLVESRTQLDLYPLRQQLVPPTASSHGRDKQPSPSRPIERQKTTKGATSP